MNKKTNLFLIFLVGIMLSSCYSEPKLIEKQTFQNKIDKKINQHMISETNYIHNQSPKLFKNKQIDILLLKKLVYKQLKEKNDPLIKNQSNLNISKKQVFQVIDRLLENEELSQILNSPKIITLFNKESQNIIERPKNHSLQHTKYIYKQKDSGVFGIFTTLGVISVITIITVIAVKEHTMLLTAVGLNILPLLTFLYIQSLGLIT